MKIHHAYRQLYREGLRAIRYSKPTRYALRDTLRKSFRSEPVANFDAARVERTLRFLQLASKERAMEHKILKNLLLVRGWQERAYKDNRL